MGRRFLVRRVLALSCALLGLPVSGALAAPVLPDLVADPPGPPSAPVVYDDGRGPRLLMRFDGFVHNAGLGALDIRATGRSGATMTNVRQRIYDSAGGPFQDVLNSPTPQVLFETDDDHDHWHLKNIARYSLWNLEGTAEAAPAQKVGFCLIDSQRMENHGPTSEVYTEPGNRFCEQGRPTVSGVAMGVSAGWRDIYHRALAFQWVDISDVAPGTYRLRAEIDPEGRIRESNELNPAALGAFAAVVPGYRATNVGVPAAPGPRQVQLAAANVGGLTRAPQFKVVTAPQHGSLDRPVGEWFDATSVVYTPAAGYSGPDSFTFAARNPASSYPRNPPAAAATLEGRGLPLVTIAGAPSRLRTGAAVRLRAVVQNDSPEVAWSVGGVAGGTKTRGRISARGLYRAPTKVPPAGRVRVTAQSASGASGDAVIRIVKAPGRRAAPDVPGGVLGRRRTSNPLSALRFARHGRKLLVSLRSAKAGLVVVGARKEGARLGRCRARVTAGQRMTCAIKLDRLGPTAAFICRVPQTSRLRLPRVRVSATLYVKGKKRAVRRARVPDLGS
jgi:hypothetical protein